MSCETTERYSIRPKECPVMEATIGDSFPLQGLVIDDDEAFNLTGCAMSWRVYNPVSGSTIYETSAFTLTAEGVFSHVVPDETTDAWPAGTYTQKLKITFADGIERTFLRGDFIIYA